MIRAARKVGMAGWFGPKRFGVGIAPRSWQGWLATACYALGMIAIAKIGKAAADAHHPVMWTVLALWSLLFAIVIAVSYRPD